MSRRLDYALNYEVCDAEDLRQTGRVQHGLRTLAVDAAGRVSATQTAAHMSKAEIAGLCTAEPFRQLGPRHALVADASGGEWLRHSHAGHTILEQPDAALKGLDDIQALDWGQLRQQARGNLWKLCFGICRKAAEALGTDRAMVYKFHPDWSGEVIAEVVSGGFEPFLGLHYPPTDVPKQARDIFLETGSRQIFSVFAGDVPLVSDDEAAEEIDLTHAMGRSCSPYHLEYLRNMGSDSTASCALVHEGRLWGLLSLHYGFARAPSLEEFAFLQDVTAAFSAALTEALTMEADQRARRAGHLQAQFTEDLAESGDPFQALMLSPFALLHLLGAKGACLLLEDERVRTGLTPDWSVIEAILAASGAGLGAMETVFLDHLPDSVPEVGRQHVAGVSITKLSDAPLCHLMTFRPSQEQTVNWGGDPRRTQMNEDQGRVSPRRSFKIWVEQVTGYSAPWTEAQMQLSKGVMGQLKAFFDVDDRELALFVRNGLRQVVRKRSQLRARGVAQVEGIRTAPAICFETTDQAQTQVVGLNAAAREAFSLTQAEAQGLSFADFQLLTGIELPSGEQGERAWSTTLASANAGIRVCEVDVELNFEYECVGSDEGRIKLEIYELRDVTEERRIEEALTAARDRAHADMKLREEFFAMLAHELRTPLNALVGLSSLMLNDKQALDDTTLERVQMMAEASTHLADLLGSVLTNSVAAQNVGQESFVPVNIAEVLASCLALIEGKAAQKGISVEIECGADVHAQGDARGIKQILLNLLSNAVKYNVQEGAIKIKVGETQAHVEIEVQDTGQGMSEAQVAECMTPYKRFAPGEGSGLGLSISNHLAALMGGVLTMSSELGIGTTAGLRLPVGAE